MLLFISKFMNAQKAPVKSNSLDYMYQILHD